MMATKYRVECKGREMSGKEVERGRRGAGHVINSFTTNQLQENLTTLFEARFKGTHSLVGSVLSSLVPLTT